MMCEGYVAVFLLKGCDVSCSSNAVCIKQAGIRCGTAIVASTLQTLRVCSGIRRACFSFTELYSNQVHGVGVLRLSVFLYV